MFEACGHVISWSYLLLPWWSESRHRQVTAAALAPGQRLLIPALGSLAALP